MLICLKAEGVHGERSVNHCFCRPSAQLILLDTVTTTACILHWSYHVFSAIDDSLDFYFGNDSVIVIDHAPKAECFL